MQTMESAHRVELKVYQQKVKHLEYQHGNDCNHVTSNAEDAQEEERKYHTQQEKNQRKAKDELKEEYKEVDYAHISVVETENKTLENKLTDLTQELDGSKKALIATYETKLAKLRAQLELQLKVEIHEIEERKNQHINDLMENHEKAFRDMKDFYQEITRENLELI